LHRSIGTMVTGTVPLRSDASGLTRIAMALQQPVGWRIASMRGAVQGSVLNCV